MEPSIEDFNQLVIQDTKVRLRLALLGDALLRLYAVQIGLNMWPNKSAGQVSQEVQPLQQNEHFILFMQFHGVKTPGGLSGKSVADYFEAWIGYLHENCGPWIAFDFCKAYILLELTKKENIKHLANLTKELLEGENNE
jgi:hypothetical protein